MPVIKANGIDICYEQTGADGNPAVLLIHGIGCQLVQWPSSFVEGLVAAGFNVIRMDNRDAGLSEKMDALGSVDLMALFTAFHSRKLLKPPYMLRNMADDAVALLDSLDQKSAHIVGVSMGGMIAQRAAIHHPNRVLSLASIMSTSGAADLPPPDPAAIGSIMTVPVSLVRSDIIAQLGQSWDLIGGPYFKSTEVGMGRLVEAAYDRGRYPAGFLRQMTAVMADTDRAQNLPRITAPTLVIHGDVDALVPLACGEDTARRIPGAKLTIMRKMGHDLPEPLIPDILAGLAAHLRAATAH